MRISEWSSDVCSSDLCPVRPIHPFDRPPGCCDVIQIWGVTLACGVSARFRLRDGMIWIALRATRSEEHTSELQSLMRISYAVFCLKKKTYKSSPTHPISKPITKDHTTKLHNTTQKPSHQIYNTSQ